MKQRFLQIISSLTAGLLVVLGLQSAAFAAASASLTFNPDSGNVTVGNQVAVTINATVTDFTAGSAVVKVVYPTDKLEYVSADESGSAFPASFPINHDASAGTIYFARLPGSSGFTGTGKVLTLNFKAKTTGTAALSFEPSISKIYENGTGAENPMTLGGSSLNLVAAAPSPSPTATSTTTAAVTTPTPTPTPTTKVTTSTKTPTPKPSAKATATPTPKPTTTTASTGTVSVDQSITQFSSTTAVADGTDTITVSVTLKDASGTIIKDVTPAITGMRENSDVASPFTYDSLTESWSSQITSTDAGIMTATLTAQNLTLNTQELTFTAPEPTPFAEAPTKQGSSFGRTIFIGFILLLLLLLLLFFLWRRLGKHDDDDDSGDFPGAGDTVAATPEAPTQESNDVAGFNPAAALQRSEEPTPPETPTPPAPPVA